MANLILVISWHHLRHFLDMVERTLGSTYWRKLGAFQWLDHREWCYELWAMWLDETGRQKSGSFFGLLGMGMRRRILESWCVVEGGVQTFFYK
jgi:hypothetical protein